jgi:hypothetical protein
VRPMPDARAFSDLSTFIDNRRRMDGVCHVQ